MSYIDPHTGEEREEKTSRPKLPIGKIAGDIALGTGKVVFGLGKIPVDVIRYLGKESQKNARHRELHRRIRIVKGRRRLR